MLILYFLGNFAKFPLKTRCIFDAFYFAELSKVIFGASVNKYSIAIFKKTLSKYIFSNSQKMFVTLYCLLISFNVIRGLSTGKIFSWLYAYVMVKTVFYSRYILFVILSFLSKIWQIPEIILDTSIFNSEHFNHGRFKRSFNGNLMSYLVLWSPPRWVVITVKGVTLKHLFRACLHQSLTT